LILPYICRSIEQLIKAGVDFIVIPCNTLHGLLPKLREMYRIRFIDLIELISKNISNYKKVGILCSSKTRNLGLYDKSFLNVEVVYPDLEEQKKISEIIIKIIRKESIEADKIFLESMIENMIKKGCEKVILGCTDLANLVGKNDSCIDTTEVLINAIIEEMKS